MRADRGRQTSHALTEIRTVLSRAETARKAIDRGAMVHDRGRNYRFEHDPEREDMLSCLDAVIDSLERWRRVR